MDRKRNYVLSWILFFAVSSTGISWAGTGPGDTGQPKASMGKPGPQTDSGEPTGAVTLKQAVVAALLKNPELQAFSLEIRAREARIIQAGLLPNPGFELGINNVIGSGHIPRSEEAQTIFSLAQLFQLGGKRAKRVGLATLDRNLAGWDYEAKRLDVLTEVTKAFIDLIAKQTRVTLAEELVRLAERVYQTVSDRVQAGKVSPIDQTKASAALSLTRLDLERAKRSLEAAKRVLAATWGSSVPTFTRAEGQLRLDPLLPTFDQISKNLEKNPDIARWDSEVEQRRASLTLEEANRIPDITLSGGVTKFNASGENGLIFGVSVPLPVFNRNQGAIAEAKTRLAKAEREKKAALLKVYSSLAEAYQRLSTAFVEAKTLEDQVLPSLQNAYEAVEEGYRYGKFGYLDVLDTQRTLFESQSQYPEALAAYKKGIAEVERLIGTSLDPNLKQK